MGFYPQPNDFTCGPFALKHALAAIGCPADEDDIASIAKTHWHAGTSEVGLQKAATAYRCDLVHERTLSADKAKRYLIDQLRTGLPALLCVDDWGHWITALRHEAGKFVVVDSDMEQVLNVLSWAQLEKRWRFHDTDYDEDDPPAVYDYLALQPRFRVKVKANFSIARLQHLRKPSNQELAARWDTYLEDLLQICRPRNSAMQNPQTMGELLRRNQERIVSRVGYWHGDVSASDIKRILSNLRFVAETYGLVIPASMTKQAVMDLTIIATMAAVAIGGLGDIYDLNPSN